MNTGSAPPPRPARAPPRALQPRQLPGRLPLQPGPQGPGRARPERTLLAARSAVPPSVSSFRGGHHSAVLAECPASLQTRML